MKQLRAYKRELSHSYSFGVFPTLELLRYRPERALRVLAHSKGEGSAGLEQVRAACHAHSVPFEVSDRAVERLAHKGNIYAVGVFEKYEAPLSQDADHVLLVSPSDHGNLGTIVRTMLSFGVSDLATLEPAAEVLNPHAVRASMGACFALNFASFSSLEAYQRSFSRALYPFMLGAPQRLGEVALAAPHTLVFGPEGAGLPEGYARVGTPLVIAQSGRTESLNLAVAVGVALYEASRGRF